MCDREVQCDLLITEESDLSGCNSTEMDSEAVDPSFKPTNEQSDDSDTSLESETNQ